MPRIVLAPDDTTGPPHAPWTAAVRRHLGPAGGADAMIRKIIVATALGICLALSVTGCHVVTVHIHRTDTHQTKSP
jgi:hypothetical protein